MRGTTTKRRKRTHECNGSFCFHGAFSNKSDADAKRRKVGKGAFVTKKWVGRGRSRFAYVVMQRDSAAEFNF